MPLAAPFAPFALALVLSEASSAAFMSSLSLFEELLLALEALLPESELPLFALALEPLVELGADGVLGTGSILKGEVVCAGGGGAAA